MKIVNTSRFLSLDQVFTGRNEVVAKVMFLHVSVILSTGGVSRQGEPPRDREPPRTKGEPPWTRENPPGPGRPPPTRENPPGTKGEPPPQTRENPRTRQTPLQTREHPPRPGRPPTHPPGSRLQNTVYERPVRILLECILVRIYFSLSKKFIESLKLRCLET